MENEGVTAEAKTVTVMVIKWIRPKIYPKSILKQLRFGISSSEITENHSQNILVRETEGLGNPLLSMITETD